MELEKLSDLNIELMFGAVPDNLIADISKKFNKTKIKNLFYIIFGLYAKEYNKYIVFSTILKSLKKIDSNKNLFKTLDINSVVFKNEQEVTDYLYKFLENFENHNRILNQDIQQMGMMPATEVFKYIVGWNQQVFDYYNELILNKNLKLTKRKNKVK